MHCRFQPIVFVDQITDIGNEFGVQKFVNIGLKSNKYDNFSAT